MSQYIEILGDSLCLNCSIFQLNSTRVHICLTAILVCFLTKTKFRGTVHNSHLYSQLGNGWDIIFRYLCIQEMCLKRDLFEVHPTLSYQKDKVILRKV